MNDISIEGGFADELSKRLYRNKEFSKKYSELGVAGVWKIISPPAESNKAAISEEDSAKLLYCASVFVQSNSEMFQAVAQSIAFNSILIGCESTQLQKAISILANMGNFPGLKYARENLGLAHESLLGIIHSKVSEEINSIKVGDDKIALTDYQKKVWDALSNGGSVAITAPTSAGKSFLVIEYICRRIVAARAIVIVYIAPTRALLSEVTGRIKKRLSNYPEVRVTSIPTVDSQAEKQVYVLTQERLKVLLSVSNYAFDVLVVDEAQNLSDGSRGMILQDCIEQSMSRNPDAHLVMLAPGADGFEEASEALGITNIEVKSTKVSPVLQNRIVVSKTPGKDRLEFGLLTPTGVMKVGSFDVNRGLELKRKLAAVALELGMTGGSLVYATGPADAEDLAGQLSIGLQSTAVDTASAQKLKELAGFIKDHIHAEYKLIGMVENGVAFHYGQMPSLLRESIEESFKAGVLRYLTCTTTLFQGVNLPARNVFIDTPTRGRGNILDAALLWNFAGRAGRMKDDIVGNVFLVDYNDWAERPMDEFYAFKIESALTKSIHESYPEVLRALRGEYKYSKMNDEIGKDAISSAGLIIARATEGDVGSFVSRVAPDLPSDMYYSISKEATNAVKSIDLPVEIIKANWMFSPYALKDLYNHLTDAIGKSLLSEIVPVNPMEIKARSWVFYGKIFDTLFMYLNGYKGRYGSKIARPAVMWMEGKPYPAIISIQIAAKKKEIDNARKQEDMYYRLNPSYKRKKIKDADVNKIIKDTFDLIEDDVRFKLVQMGKAYIDLLRYSLVESNMHEYLGRIYDFSLALEIGVSSETERSFVELGLSRIAATALQGVYPDSSLTVDQARSTLRTLRPEDYNLSPVIRDELKRLGLTTLEM